MISQSFLVGAEQTDKTLASLMRFWLPDQSWSQVRQMVAARRVRLNGELWFDETRRLKEGDAVEVLSESAPKISYVDHIVIRHIDEHLIVVEKPSGIPTVRHPAERDWPNARREKVPTLDDLVLRQTGMNIGGLRQGKPARLRIVQRLDKETSGLIVFARSVDAERGLGAQFRKHTVIRRYLAIVAGKIGPQTVRSSLIRDRGDGRRGSTHNESLGKLAVTHIEVAERLPNHTILSCRLETGRTHQIRIHLAERGHPILGERVYDRPTGKAIVPDKSGAPRLALHAAELGFRHPISEEDMHWEMPLPPDLREFVAHLRGDERDST